jgi:hypothetical protein
MDYFHLTTSKIINSRQNQTFFLLYVDKTRLKLINRKPCPSKIHPFLSHHIVYMNRREFQT